MPIEPLLPDLFAALQAAGAAVLQAPPGAGKTTRVPLALLGEPWLERRIVMLEPRRLAARAAARYMARALGEEVGQTVGYRVRHDTRISASTRVEVVTEGVLTRMLQSDPALESADLVIFDEFHERSLHADLGLALTLQARALLRPELRLLVMSATLDGQRVSELLGDAPIVTSHGRSYPVETQYLNQKVDGHIEPAVTRAVIAALKEFTGDVLAFLPGAAEIARVHAALQEERFDNVDLHPLYGNLPADAQDRAIAPSVNGRRKVVLATAIAETSLTIDGIRIVVDGGLMRVPHFSPRTGMTRLETVRVTRDSADQRRGRAGRTAPGVCIRLWTEAEQATLLERREAEILQADLAPLALDLLVWGASDPLELQWLDPPPAAAYAQARELLRELGAITADGAITAHGRELTQFGVHPRLAHMLLRGKQLGAGTLAAQLAALLGERDLLRNTADPDVGLRLQALRTAGSASVDRATLQRVRTEATDLERRLGAKTRPQSNDAPDAGALLGLAYPDRIAQRRGSARGRFLLRNGRGAVLDPASPLAAADYIVAAQVDDRGADTRVFLAGELSFDWLTELFADQIETIRSVEWDRASRRITARERQQLGAIVLKERPFEPEPEEVAAALLAAIRREGIDILPWSRAAQQLRARLAFLHAIDSEWPNVSDQSLLDNLESWLSPIVGASPQLDRLDVVSALHSLLTWQQRAALDEWAPTHIITPSGSNLPIDYSDPAAPMLPVRLQEVFGWQQTPRIAGGRVPITMQLLSPASRPVQITRDLASFWKTTYFDVKKDLKGRYPKHYWPDNPESATATRRVRPKRAETDQG